MNLDLPLPYFLFPYLLGIILLIANLSYIVWKKKRNKEYKPSPICHVLMYYSLGAMDASFRFPINTGNALIDFLDNSIFYTPIITIGVKILRQYTEHKRGKIFQQAEASSHIY
jgi:hypothetical protein